jgi:hypothetical protein
MSSTYTKTADAIIELKCIPDSLYVRNTSTCMHRARLLNEGSVSTASSTAVSTPHVC